MKQSVAKEASDIQALIDMSFLELVHECKSRSGLIDLDSTNGHGSTFNVLLYTASTLYDSNKDIDVLINDITNKFMILQHELVVSRKHFNWNW